MRCQSCNREFTVKDLRSTKFCSRSCAAKYNNTGRRHSAETKAKIKASLAKQGCLFGQENQPRLTSDAIKAGAERRKRRKMVSCGHCGAAFEVVKSSARKYCSDECRAHYKGGLRLGTGRSRGGWYKGIWCDSTWELAFVIYMLDHGREIARNQQSWLYVDASGKIRKYYPDFAVDGKLYEIKGLSRDIDTLKHRAVDVEVLHGKDAMQTYLDFVSRKYAVAKSKLWTLYDNAPVYEHVCKQCAVTFEAHDAARTYCSNRCSGRGVSAARTARKEEMVPHDRIELSLAR